MPVEKNIAEGVNQKPSLPRSVFEITDNLTELIVKGKEDPISVESDYKFQLSLVQSAVLLHQE